MRKVKAFVNDDGIRKEALRPISTSMRKKTSQVEAVAFPLISPTPVPLLDTYNPNAQTMSSTAKLNSDIFYYLTMENKFLNQEYELYVPLQTIFSSNAGQGRALLLIW